MPITGLNINEKTVVEEVIQNCMKHYQVHFPVCKEYVGLPELCAGIEGLGDF